MATAELARVPPDAGTYSHLAAWVDRLRERTAYQIMMKTTQDYIAQTADR